MDEKVQEKNLEHMGTVKNFLNRKSMTYALRSTSEKWTSQHCKASVRQRTLLIGQNGNQQIGKGPLPIIYLIESLYLIYTEDSRS